MVNKDGNNNGMRDLKDLMGTKEVDTSMGSFTEDVKGIIGDVNTEDLAKLMPDTPNKSNADTLQDMSDIMDATIGDKNVKAEDIEKEFGKEQVEALNESINEWGTGLKEFTEVYAEMKTSAEEKIETKDIIETRKALGENVTTEQTKQAPIPDVENKPVLQFTPTETKKKSITVEHKNKRVNTLSSKIKNRNKKGKYSSGFLYDSNLMVRVYSMNTPLKKQDVIVHSQYRGITSFERPKMIRELFDHCTIMASDGHAIDFPTFLSIVHLSDASMLVGIALSASVDDATMKDFPLQCTPTKEAGGSKSSCKAKYKHDINLVEVIDKALKDNYIQRRNSYDRTKNVEELVNTYIKQKSQVLIMKDDVRNETVKVYVSSPTLDDYFKTSESIKEYILRSMLQKPHVVDYIREAYQGGSFTYKTIDDQLIILSITFPSEYEELQAWTMLTQWIDKIEIYPNEVLANADVNMEDYEDEIIIADFKDAPLNELEELFKTLDSEMYEGIRDAIDTLSDTGTNDIVLDIECPECGTKQEIVLDMFSLFLEWAQTEPNLKK